MMNRSSHLAGILTALSLTVLPAQALPRNAAGVTPAQLSQRTDLHDRAAFGPCASEAFRGRIPDKPGS